MFGRPTALLKHRHVLSFSSILLDADLSIQHVALLTLLLQPALLIIDSGHFQYNSVMLGMFVSFLQG